MLYLVAVEQQAPIAQSVDRPQGKEKVNGSVPFGGSDKKYKKRAPAIRRGPSSVSRRPLRTSAVVGLRDAHRQNGHVVRGRLRREALHGPQDTRRDRTRRQPGAVRQHIA